MERLSTLFAKRYLLSKKSHSVINTISRVSVFAIGVPVAAMIILLSVFNGFEGLVKSMYGDFDPDIAVVPKTGKFFETSQLDQTVVLSTKGVAAVSWVLEDNALLEYRGRQFIGTVRGVDDNYNQVVPIDRMLVAGQYELWFGDIMQGVVGQGLAYNLGIRTALFDPLRVLAPRRGGTFSSLLPLDNYRQGELFPSGVFALDAETDGKYVITPIEFTRNIFERGSEASMLMVKLHNGTSEEQVRKLLSEVVGSDFRVLTRYEQKASLYKIMTYEKWGIFVIISLVLVIASFSLIGSIVMLIIEKRSDIRTLLNLGAGVPFVRSVFIKEGMLISLLGGFSGLILGLLLCWLQVRFGLVRIPADTFLVDSYPVMVKMTDILVVAFTFIAVNFLIAIFTVRNMIPKSRIRL